MPKERFCLLCKCGDHMDMPKGLDKNLDCPILGAKICAVCCHYEVEGGFGAPDTLRQMCKISGKTKLQVHEACVACPHGGETLAKPRKLISIRDARGNQIKSGPAFEKAQRENDEEWKRRFEALKEESR